MSQDIISFQDTYRNAIISMAIEEGIIHALKEKDDVYESLMQNYLRKNTHRKHFDSLNKPKSLMERVNLMRLKGLNSTLREKTLSFLALYGKSNILDDFPGSGLLNLEEFKSNPYLIIGKGPSLGTNRELFTFAREQKGLILGDLKNNHSAEFSEIKNNYEFLLEWHFSDTRNDFSRWSIELEDEALVHIENGNEGKAKEIIEKANNVERFGIDKRDNYHYTLIRTAQKWEHLFKMIGNENIIIKSNVIPYIDESAELNKHSVYQAVLNNIALPKLYSLNKTFEFIDKYSDELNQIRELINVWHQSAYQNKSISDKYVTDEINKIVNKVSKINRITTIAGVASIPIGLIPTHVTIGMGVLLGLGSTVTNELTRRKNKWLLFTEPGIKMKRN